MPTILHIALPVPLRKIFDYLAPANSAAIHFPIGARVQVPFGQRQLIGIIVKVSTSSDVALEKLRAAHQVMDTNGVLSAEIMELCRWVSEYYHHPFGEVLQVALPAQMRKDAPLSKIILPRVWRHTHEGKGLPASALRGKKQQQVHQFLLHNLQLAETQLSALSIAPATLKTLEQKGLIAAFDQPLKLPNELAEVLAETPMQLNLEQQAALKSLRFHRYATYLLDGETGSGKTEVYLQAITRVLQAGKQALLLVPEIGLTPQTMARFERRFRVPVVQLHSSISASQRTQSWSAAATGQARIVIGTRLAVFTPMPELGIIILDEEHDLSFKQQDGLRYSARDVAIVRAHRLQIPLILGSATPALETLHNAQQGRYQHLRLTQRAGDACKPEIHCVDMRQEPIGCLFSAAATAAMATALQRGEQVLVFINRRGFAPALLCHNCGWSAACKACDKRMTVHNFPRHLHCHHCDHQRPLPNQCPVCHNRELDTRGQGTERCELVLQKMFPKLKVIRVDQDSMQSKNAMKDLIDQVNLGDPCILVGTQMLAKGHHFAKVTVVVLMDIDQGLFSGDFRGPERMGQQIVQVSGRAGREQLKGVVLLQTHQPQHPLLQCLLQNSYHTFANEILRERSVAGLPPVHHMVMLRAESKRAEVANEFLQFALHCAREIVPPTPEHRYLGPIPALQEKRNDRFRFQLQMCFTRRAELQQLISRLLPKIETSALASRTRWSIDIDPQDMS